MVDVISRVKQGCLTETVSNRTVG